MSQPPCIDKSINYDHEQAVRGIWEYYAFEQLLGDGRNRPMSDHFSGPQAIAGPAGNITDSLCVPQPRAPGSPRARAET